jgi:hypothetical protein
VPVRSTKQAAHVADVRIDIDLDVAKREAERVKSWLKALRQRHDLSRYEYTRHVRIVPASTTYSHPILTLGTRFTETEDHLLATYLHEQMHWYLYLLGGPDHDPITPFFDELVRRYPDAPTQLPEGARNYEQTYAHLVINWLELHTVAQFIGKPRAAALAETQYGYRWIYRTVLKDWDELGALYRAHAILPIKPAHRLLAAASSPRRIAAPASRAKRAEKSAPPAKSPKRVKQSKKSKKAAEKRSSLKSRAVRQKTRAGAASLPSREPRRRPRARGGRSPG